jgi:TonB family protein
MEIDGHPVAAGAGDRVAIGAPGSTALWIARAPGDPFQRILVRGAGESGPLRVVVVAETSAALGTSDRVLAHRALQTVLRALPAAARVTILAADWNTSAIAESVAPAEAERALGRLDAVVGAGALHLERALSDAFSRAKRDNGAVLFVGAGVDPFPGDALRAPLLAARDADLRLSIVTVGPPPDPLADAAAVTGGVALEAGTIAATMPELLAALRPRPPRPALEARGLDGWRPLETSDGGTVWVGRALDGPAAANGPSPGAAEPGDLLALWDRARLSWSERGNQARAGSGDRAALAPLRALLVLENDAEYARYGLAAPVAFAEAVNEAGKAGAAAHRTARSKEGLYGLRGNDSAPASEILGPLMDEQVRNAGVLGTIGTGASYGVGGLGGRRAAPEVVPETASVRGSLDKEIVRRIVRRHLNELRYCYQQDARSHGAETGRIVVQFSISASGKVASAEQRTLSMVNPPVGRCFVEAVRRWEFPPPVGGGTVLVSFPFALLPTGDASVGLASSPPAASSVPTPAPAIEDALAILAGREPLAARLARVCERLGLDRTVDPETAAWSIDRHDVDLSTVVLVSRLLAAAGRSADGVRVLSERASSAPDAVVAELRRLGAARDAEEVVALQKREP